jgi:hypothetical protein
MQHWLTVSSSRRMRHPSRRAGNILVRARAPPRRAQAAGAGASGTASAVAGASAADEGEAGLPATLPQALAAAAASADPARGVAEVAERLQLVRRQRCVSKRYAS